MVALCSFRRSGPPFANLAPYVGLVANGLKDGIADGGLVFLRDQTLRLHLRWSDGYEPDNLQLFAPKPFNACQTAWLA